MRINNLFIIFLFSISLIHIGTCIILEGAAIGAALLGYTFQCKFWECCDTDYVPLNTTKLKLALREQLYGQQIAQDIVFSAIHSHVHHENPRKALVLSLHGLPGSGKNYIVTMIANALFKKGEESKFYHFFNGRSDFPSDKNVELYKYDLKEKIQRALDKCARTMFVFDEVDKIPPGVLDVLVPFLDYTSWNGREKSKAIFIFLSNTGSEQIVRRMIDLWQSGKNRDETNLQDFESLIAIGAFNEEGGLYKSGTIESKLIDHHVPFLPMEQKQVIMCIKYAFKHWGAPNPSNSMIQEVLEHVIFGPPPHNLYSTSGCKTLDHKVTSILHRNELDLKIG